MLDLFQNLMGNLQCSNIAFARYNGFAFAGNAGKEMQMLLAQRIVFMHKDLLYEGLLPIFQFFPGHQIGALSPAMNINILGAEVQMNVCFFLSNG